MLLNRDDLKVVNLDILTYAGNLENLSDVDSNPNYLFVKGDITDAALMDELFQNHKFDYVVNFAAESHVDRSILGSEVFIKTERTWHSRHCSKQPKNTALKSLCKFPPTKFTAAWAQPVCLPSKQTWHRTVPIPQAKHPLI
ncbi:MAG: GDP-mannose 4,6-dehydratase [Melioribacteraceae bacterium]|nr:GDP-mannose 4,6-dehydratase [Melioribacteraceae bacterium]